MKRRLIQLMCIIKYYIVLIVIVLFRIKKKKCWLISERGFEARDNGYYFYRFLKNEKKEYTDNVKYIISKKSHDIKKIEKEDIIFYRSFKHIYYFILSEVLISTHIMGTSPNFEAFMKLDSKKLVYTKGKRVYLQHGIDKDYYSKIDEKKVGKLDMICFGAKREYDFAMLDSPYNKSVFKQTGLARYDSLLTNKNKVPVQKIILVMPTWRLKYSKLSIEKFLLTDYFENYIHLLDMLVKSKFVIKNQYQVIFYPHIEMHKFLPAFGGLKEKGVKVYDSSDADVQELLLKSEILITDYSSVFFDFALLKKKIFYFQYDYSEFRKSHYKEGWYSYLQDGFGPICQDVTSILNLLESGHLDEIFIEYTKRIELFFNNFDCFNCRRIYDEIRKMLINTDGREEGK